MSKQKIFTYLYFIILLMDACGVIFPDILPRKYITFFPLPILLILYLFSVKKINWYYILGITFTFLGVIFFNRETSFKFGLIFYAVGVFLYVIISLKHAEVISTKSICLATIPFLIIYLVPLVLCSDVVEGEIFNYIMLYVFFVGFFFLISTLIYINQRNRINLWLLYSGVLFLISTTMHGYSMFFGEILILDFCIIVTFLLMHYAMCKYVIQQKN